MGVDYDTKLIVGYELDLSALKKWAARYYPDAIQEGWLDISEITPTLPIDPSLPTGIHMTVDTWEVVSCSPYFDCPSEDRSYYLTLASHADIADFEEGNLRKEVADAGKACAEAMGATSAFHVDSVLNVF